MTTLLQDLRFAVRQMRRSPGFARTAIFTLALGIAANVIVFGVLQALFLRPIDVPHADRVMTLAYKTDHLSGFLLSGSARCPRWKFGVLRGCCAHAIDNFGLESNGITRPIWGCEVSGQYFEVIAIKPFLGRLLQRADDDHPGASQAAVLSFRHGRATLAPTPISWAKLSVSISSPTPSSALPRKTSTAPKNLGSPKSLFPWRTKHRSTRSTGLSRGKISTSIPSCASRMASPCPRCRRI